MKIGILIFTGPYQHQASDTAYNFIKAAMKKGHEITGVFFYTDGIYNVNKNIESLGERNIAKKFLELGFEGLKLYACVACAKFRGLTDDSLIENAQIVGLGELSDIIEESDRFVCFGG